MNDKPTVVVCVVTYRRPHLLRRALESLVAQTFSDWQARVVNDAPDNSSVEGVIATVDDPRIALHLPLKKRGAAGSFNEAFKPGEHEFGALLEDDNWWEPEFLEVMVGSMRAHPDVGVCCMNEIVWRETESGWVNTERTIWPVGPDRLYTTSVMEACGSAKICNSSLLVRTPGNADYLTPNDIPVDVTEHFRERCLPQPVLLVNRALVNYAETLSSNRDQSGIVWSAYQAMLIGSCFTSLPHSERRVVAKGLLDSEGRRPTIRSTSLLQAAVHFPAARVLWGHASWAQRARALVAISIRFPRFLERERLLRTERARAHFAWLLESPYNRSLST